MKKQIELRLVPAPGAKPEFLAVVEQKDSTSGTGSGGGGGGGGGGGDILASITSKNIILEGYTREPWALDTSTKEWKSFQVVSVDGRKKLPGFVNYLRERKKTAFGRFNSNQVWVVPYKQMNSNTLHCRITAIDSIPNCPLKKQQRPGGGQQQQVPAAAKQSSDTTSSTGNKSYDKGKKKGKGIGLLGNLVSAQKRTNQHMQIAASVPPKATQSQSQPLQRAAGGGAAAAAATNVTSGSIPSSSSSTSNDQVELKTAGQVLADFRQEMEQQMLDFDLSSEPVLKVKIDVPSKLKLMSQEEQQSGRITMEILKYIVYEQAEEVNEEWIAHKEPSEFTDEAIIAIYKEGEAPPEVIEDMNKADLPDEIRGQQLAIQQEQQKEQVRKQQKLIAFKQAQALKKQTQTDEHDNDFAALNTNKRDRRTIEDFQRDANKQQRLE